jgi:hypothetical protein
MPYPPGTVRCILSFEDRSPVVCLHGVAEGQRNYMPGGGVSHDILLSGQGMIPK